MKSCSSITGQLYENEDMVFFRNTLQSAFYVANSASLQDIFVDDKMRFVFVFTKKDHDKLKFLWRDSDVQRKQYEQKVQRMREKEDG